MTGPLKPMPSSNGPPAARRDPTSALQTLKRDHPGWHDEDCQHVVRDLASLRTAEVADGIRLGDTWPQLSSLAEDRPVLILEALGTGIGPAPGRAQCLGAGDPGIRRRPDGHY